MRLEAIKICKNFGEMQVLKDVSLSVSDGEIVSLLGESGVGKTTLFNILAGLNAPTSGDVRLGGESIVNTPGKVSYMLQKDLLLPHKTVLDNVCLPLVIRGMKKQTAREMARLHFKEFGLDGVEKKYPSQLSGGMRQRAAFLRTYLFSRDVALLDEPFSALDPGTKAKMHRWYLEVMRQINLSTIFVTHDVDEALLLSDRIYIMRGQPGRISHEIKIERSSEKTPNFSLSNEFFEYKKYVLSLFGEMD